MGENADNADGPAALSVPRRRLLPSPHEIFRALRHRNYRLFWTGYFLSNIGSWMQNVAQGWLVLQLTDSSFLLGLVAFANSLPMLFLLPVGGVIADRLDRRRLMLVTQAAMMALALMLAVLTSRGAIVVWEIVAISFFTGLAMSLNAPSYQAMVQDLVGREDLMNAIALNATQFNLSRAIGPAIAGWIIAGAGIAFCFYLNALSFLAVILALGMIRVRESHQAAASSKLGSVWDNLMEAAAYVRESRLTRALLLLIAVISIFGLPYLVLMPVFARDVLGVGARGLGYLMSASGSGAVAGALFVASYGSLKASHLMLRAGAILLSASLIVFSFSPIYQLSLLALFLIGFAMSMFIATTNTTLQVLVPAYMRGRIMSLYALGFVGLSPLGSLQAGAIAHYLGAPAALGTGSIICLALSLFLLPGLTRELSRSAG